MEKQIVYIPLDDRPVCYKRVELLAKSTGLQVIIPPKELIKTVLDGQPKTIYNKTCGDIYELKKWFLNLNHSEINYYIICIDQILSGGLVNSRHDYYQTFDQAKEFIDVYLDKSIIKDKKVILIDSVDRLACTCGYDGCDLTIYEGTRQYASVARKLLSNDYSLEDIFETYKYDENDNLIDNKSYNLSDEYLEKYLSNRRRKALVNEYLIHKTKELKSEGFDIYYILGIDDSMPKVTIQTNEIKYFERLISKDFGIIFCGIDELPLMAVTRMSRSINKIGDVNASFHYIGSGADKPGDVYDTGTILESIDKHLKVLEVNQTNSDSLLHVVMLTYSKSEAERIKDIDDATNLINSLLDKNKLVCVMDLTSSCKAGPFEKEIIKRVPLSKVFAWSNWNTVANSIGISLSCALARMYYLQGCKNNTIESTINYSILHAFSYFKDVSYKITIQKSIIKYTRELTNDTRSYLNFYEYLDVLGDINSYTLDLLLDPSCDVSIFHFMKNLLSGDIIHSIHDGIIEYVPFPKLEVVGCSYPWYRTFELDIDIIKGDNNNENN